MMTKKSWAIGVVVVVAFGAGWLGAKLADINKMPLGEVYATRWNSGVQMLVNSRQNLTFADPSTIRALIGEDIETDSTALAYMYDDLSPMLKQLIVFDLPQARVIAKAGESGGLQIFIDCVQQIQTHGGSVRKCVLGNRNWKKLSALPPVQPRPSDIVAKAAAHR